ncbi:transporter substrate-binding domain-containing protein [Simiduia curdlanivorans]|uniref:Substrate-binding periplasmic protein n=1 Tax=Simiduia curdlanivorans TaxID=1492769 RepID=A0ABV8UZU7_9GAMM|nr:transporter substrate-binding domain-containing protein [Simiduia curdlanivorans]MDN3639198.1 transporter substrate-binding domain-containing protein [Simiduia curdlanivorans]
MDDRNAYLSLLISAIWALVISSTSAASNSQPPLIFNTSLRPPYQVLGAAGQLSGHTVQAMRCISQHMKQDWQLYITPWARGLHNLKAGTITGVFPVYEAPEAGRLSAPLMVERWFWYYTEQRNYYEKSVKIGAVRNSNEHHWLNSQGLKPRVLVAEEAQLIRLLQQGRIDGFVSNELSAAYWMDSEKVNTSHWQQRFVRFTPLYLALAETPAPEQRWVDEVNFWASQCSIGTTLLTDSEKATLSDKLRDYIQQLPLADINALLAQKQPQLSAQQLSQREAIWQEKTLANIDFIDHTLSKKLQDFVSAHPDVISEVFIMGEQGETLACNHKLSDYWQGDEDKFLKSQSLAGGEFFIEAIAYDASSQAFVAHVSWPIYLQGLRQGSITLGVRVEKLLAKRD